MPDNESKTYAQRVEDVNTALQNFRANAYDMSFFQDAGIQVPEQLNKLIKHVKLQTLDEIRKIAQLPTQLLASDSNWEKYDEKQQVAEKFRTQIFSPLRDLFAHASHMIATALQSPQPAKAYEKVGLTKAVIAVHPRPGF